MNLPIVLDGIASRGELRRYVWAFEREDLERFKFAIHEAGHALCCIAQDVPLTFVDVIQDGEIGGCCRHACGPDTVFEQLVILFGGCLAELRSGYFDRVGGDRFRTIGALHRGASQDRQDAARLIARLPIWTRTTAEERAKDRARDILDRYESALHAITLALSMRNILDGPTAVLCFEWAESLR